MIFHEVLGNFFILNYVFFQLFFAHFRALSHTFDLNFKFHSSVILQRVVKCNPPIFQNSLKYPLKVREIRGKVREIRGKVRENTPQSARNKTKVREQKSL